MPGPLIRQSLLPVVLFLLASSAPRRARAADGASHECVAGLRIKIGPETLEPQRAHGMLEQVVAELGPQSARSGAPCDDAATRIDVDVGETQTRVVVEAQAGGERRRIERTLDVSGIAEDGRPLAVAIAVDEMAREAREELTIRPPPKPVPPPPVPPPPPVVPQVRPAQGTLGLTLGFDAFTRGVTLLGTDARGALFLGEHFALGGRAGVRDALAWRGGRDEAWVVGASLTVGPDVRASSGVAGVVALDALLALSGSHNEAAGTVAPSVGGTAWLGLGGGVQLTLDARVGAPFSTLRAPRQDGESAAGAGGAMLTASLGLVAVF